MARRLSILSILVVFLLSTGLVTNVTAASFVRGTFIEAIYDEIQGEDEQIEKRLKAITIANRAGKTTTFNIDQYADLTVNGTPTTIAAFKRGMEVEAEVNLHRVMKLRGKSGESQGKIDPDSRVVVGTVNDIDPNGKYLSLRLDDGRIQTYYFHSQTDIFKDTTLVGLSEIFEGDRVILKFSDYHTNLISTIEVNVQGTKIEALYKGKIQQIEPIGNRITITDEEVFWNWKWESTFSKNKSYPYSARTPIYIGNRQVPQDQLRYYKNHDVYYVTVNQFGQEMIEKMVIKEQSERSYYEDLTAIYPYSNAISLERMGRIPYHNGTILIRNGRLVDENSLYSRGTALVLTDGNFQNQFANVIHVTNDGFQSPNLTGHALYFGKITGASDYELALRDAKLLSNHYWNSVSRPIFTFSNDTFAVRDHRRSVLKILPRNELDDEIGEYGYFYVKDNHILAAHILDKKTRRANLVSVGRLTGTRSNPERIQVHNVSQWKKGRWEAIGDFSSMNIEQATIIRDGKVITMDDLSPGDRLFIVHESNVKGRVIFVE